MYLFKRFKKNEYYKYKNETVTVYIPEYEKYLSFHTDIFNLVMDHFKISGEHCHSVINKINTPQTFFRRFYYKRLLPRQIIYRLSYEILLSTPTNTYFLTINKLGNLGNDKNKSRKLMKEFIKRLRQRAIGRKNRSYLTGFVIEERGHDESYHYHIILNDPNNALTNDLTTFYKQVELTIASLNRSCFSSNNFTSNSLTAIPKDCWDVQEYYKQTLEEYVTKNFENTDAIAAGDTIGIITPPDDVNLQDVNFGDF